MDKTRSAAETAQAFRRHARGWLRRRFPLGAELRGYTRAKLRADLLAGANVALVSIPQAVAFALIAGLPPLMVIMCVVVGGFVAALFSSSHHLVFGPTNSISLVLATTIFALRGSGLAPTHIALLLACLIGLFQLAAGLARLGKLTQFVSHAVIIAYGTAIGLLLALSQVPHLLGLATQPGSPLAGLWQVAGSLADINPWALAMGAVTLLLFHLAEKIAPKVPPELPVLVLLALFARFADLRALGVRTIADEGALAVSLPTFLGIPLNAGSLGLVPPLLGSALAIAILGMLEAVSIAKTLAARSGQRLDANQELVAMGLGNLACSAFGAMPGSASFARSGANLQSGARTQVAALASSLLVLAALFFVTPLVNFIPVPCLAAHLVRIGLRMLDRGRVRIACRATRADAMVFTVTLLAAFFLQLDIAIYVGVGTSLALFLEKAGTPSLVEYGFDGQGQLTQLAGPAARGHAAVAIVHVEGDLFFGAADLLQEQVRLMADDGRTKVVILRMKNARHLDATGVMSLLELHGHLRRTGRHLIISGAGDDVERVLAGSGALAQIGPENVFPAEANLTMSTRRALLRARALLGDEAAPGKAEVRIFYDRPQPAFPNGARSQSPETPEDYQI
jgi:SulP family sulfate permease